MINPIIEAMARAITEGMWPDWEWQEFPDADKDKGRKLARAAYLAIPEAMTDEQMFEFAPLWNPWGANAFTPKEFTHQAHVRRKRDEFCALIDAKEGERDG